MTFDNIFHHPDMQSLLGFAEEAEKRIAAEGRAEWIRLKEPGEIFVAILPSWRKEPPYYLHKLSFSHFIVEGKGGTTQCPEADGSGKCPVDWVIQAMLANGKDFNVDQKTFRRHMSRAQAQFNVVPLVRQGNLLVPKDGAPKAHILSCASRLADWVYSEGKTVTDDTGRPNFFDPTCAMAVKIERKEVNGFTNWDFNWAISGSTGRTVLVRTEDEAQALSATLRDLDKIFDGKWNDDEWTKSVDLSLKLMQMYRFRPLPLETIKHHCPPPGKKVATEAPAVDPNAGAGFKEVVVPTPSPSLGGAVLAQVEAEVQALEIILDPNDGDPNNIDAASGRALPKCIGNQSTKCPACWALPQCVMETISNSMRGAR